jgi:hypothetical protein
MFPVMFAHIWDNALRPLPVRINHGEVVPHSAIRRLKSCAKRRQLPSVGHKNDASVALHLRNKEWVDIGIGEFSRFSKEGPNSKKWDDDTFKVIRLMRDMLVDIHKAIKGDMVQLRKVIVWGIVSSGM